MTSNFSLCHQKCCISFSLHITPIAMHACVCSGTRAQYQWSCSPLDTANNRYLIPDLGIRDDGDVADIRGELDRSDTSLTYFFPIPPTLNCSGTVSAVQFCYLDNIPRFSNIVFTLLTLERNDLDFEVISQTTIRSSPSPGLCTTPFLSIFTYCCDTVSLGNFDIPAPNFTFGVVLSSALPLLTYEPENAGNQQFLVEHFRYSSDRFLFIPGSVISLTEEDRFTNQTLRLIQFFISES